MTVEYKPAYSLYSVVKRLSTDLPQGFKFSEYPFYRVDFFDQLDPYLRQPYCVSILGTYALQQFLHKPFFQSRAYDLDNLLDHEAAAVFNTESIRNITSLWFVKDCACAVDSTILVDDFNKRCTVLEPVTTYFDAASSLNTVHFSQAEVELALVYQGKYEAITTEDISIGDRSETIKNNHIGGAINYINFNSLNRIERAYHFIESARQESFLPSKISTYVMLLECLFSTAGENTEVSYKIAHRVAAYLEQDNKFRKDIFDQVSKFYSLRSHYVHGQGVKIGGSTKSYSKNQITDFSIEIDSLIRRVFYKILDSPNDFLIKDQNIFQKWLNGLYYQ